MRLKVSNVCQLLDKSKYPATKTENGITWTNNGDGTITTTGTVSNLGAWLNIDNSTVVLISSHKYLLCGCPSGGTTDTYWLRLSPSGTGDPKDLGSGIIFTAQETATYHPLLQINPGQGDNLVWKPQLFDLTEMYGIGNEPTTVEQFRQDFPNEMYEYSPECWKRLRRLKYIANKQPVQLYAKNIWKEYTDLYGVSIKNNNDGSITLNGTATETFFFPNELYEYNLYNYLTLNRGKYIANKEPIQLFNKDQYMEPTSPKWGIDIIKNSDGTITLNGTATSSGNLYQIQTVALIKNHKYYIFANQEGSFANIVLTVNNLGSSDVSQGNIWTYTKDNATEAAYFYVASGTVISNRVYKPQLFDLTEMYGVGNEPTTVEQFRVDYPNELYDYNPYNAITFR